MADAKISELPAGTAAGTDEVPVNKAGTTTKITAASIRADVVVPIDLAADVTGDLPVADGGTGSSTAAGARANLDVDQAGTDNSTDVTLAGTPDYITISGQEITRGPIDLTADVSGTLPVANGGTGAVTHGSGNVLLGAGASAVTSAKAAPSGDFVGTTDAQTLSAKTLAGVTLSGAVVGGDQAVDAIELGDYAEALATDATFTGAETLDFAAGPYFAVTLTGDVTGITVNNPPTTGRVGTMTIEVTQDSTPRTIVWPTGTKWAGGDAPTLSAGSGAIDVLTLVTRDGGTSWLGFVGGQDFS